VGLVMSLASDDSTVMPLRTDERPPRWSRMRSREGSEAGTPSESANGNLRMPYSGTRFESNVSRTQSGPSMGPQSAENSSTASSLRSGRATSSSAARERADAVEEAEMSRIINHVGRSCIDRYGSLQLAFHDLLTDTRGNLRQHDLRRFFESHHVASRIADRFFTHMVKDRRSSTIHVQELKGIFDELVGQHLEKKSAKNVHGLLRPLKKSSFMDDVGCTAGNMAGAYDGNARHHDDPVSAERMKHIVKAMTSREQRRFIDKSGEFRREDLQTLFWSYGLKAVQANELFDRIDTDRNGEISFKELNAYLPGFLGVPKEKERKKEGAKYKQAFDKETMTTICDHLGTKAGQKHRRVYDAFRFVDRDGDETVDRWEVRNFFRNYGSKTKIADIFFDTLDPDRQGKISYVNFQKQFTPYIQPGYHAPKPGECQKSFYGGKDAKCYQSSRSGVADGRSHTSVQPPVGADGNPHVPTTGGKIRRPRSNRSGSSAASVSSSQCQDELHQNRFGQFDGISTYQASFTPRIFSHC